MGTGIGVGVSPCFGRRAVAPAWTPSTNDLLSWVELRNGYTTAVGVTNIPDLGSMGGAMAQTVDADEPAEATIGSQPAAEFDGIDSALLHSAGAAAWKKLSDGTGCTFYFVVDEPLIPEPTSGAILGTGRNTSPTTHTGFQCFRTGNFWQVRVSNGSGTYVVDALPTVPIGLGVYAVRFAIGASPEFEVRRNGATILAVATATGTPAPGNPNSALQAGEQVGTGNHLEMLYGGHLLYGVRHDDETVAANEAALMALYGVS